MWNNIKSNQSTLNGWRSVEIRDEIQKEHNKFQELSHASGAAVRVLFNVMHKRFVSYKLMRMLLHARDDDDDGGNACFAHIYMQTHTWLEIYSALSLIWIIKTMT